jgi:hypothetical protein
LSFFFQSLRFRKHIVRWDRFKGLSIFEVLGYVFFITGICVYFNHCHFGNNTMKWKFSKIHRFVSFLSSVRSVMHLKLLFKLWFPCTFTKLQLFVVMLHLLITAHHPKNYLLLLAYPHFFFPNWRVMMLNPDKTSNAFQCIIYSIILKNMHNAKFMIWQK